jgi:hypothetical protein
MCGICCIEDEYGITNCSKCGAWICLSCNFFIPDKKVIMKNSEDTAYLEKILKKHSKTCNKQTEYEKDIAFEFKYCNGCKSQNKELIDKIEEVDEEEEEESYNNFCNEVKNNNYQPYLKFKL